MKKIYVIYRTPTDYPTSPFVMRVHHVDRGKVKATNAIWKADTLEEIRRNVPIGSVCFDRHERDEPQIVEWWL